VLLLSANRLGSASHLLDQTPQNETLLNFNNVETDKDLLELQEQILEAKREILKLQEEKENEYKRRRLWYWVPSPKQLTFFENSGKKRRAGFCGNRFGKSTLGVVEDVCWLIGYRPFFPVGHPLRTLGIPAHGVKGLVVAEDWDKVKEIFTNDDSIERQGKFLDFLPADFIKKQHRNEKGIIDQITVISEVNGTKRESIVYFDTVKSFKNAPASFESSDWDFVHIDEPVMKELWVAVSRGLIDRGGYSWWLFTPLKEVWMYNETIENAKEQPQFYWWFEATMDDNPTLSDEDKKLYLDQLPEDERAARRAGKPLAYGRLVFHQFSPVEHEVDCVASWPTPSRPPEKDHMVVYALDTHPHTPHAALFAAVNKFGDIDFYDEIYEKGTIAKLAELVQAKLQGVRVGYGLCEPAAWNEDQGSGKSYADMFAEAGLDLIPASKRKEDAILQTQLLLGQRKRTVRIHKRCKRLRWEMFNHYFDKDNHPEDKNDHLIECLRRLVIHDGLTYYPATWGANKQQFTSEKDLFVKQSHLELGVIGSLTNL
jgi:hypothetical protein